MLQKLIFVSVVIFALTATAFPQKVKELKISGSCNYYGESLGSDVYTFESDQEAIDAVDNILNPVGLVRNFDIRAADVDNAAAVIIPGDSTRYILYNQAFMRRVKNDTKTDWAAISIMAHEIGHHLNGHSLIPGGSRPKLELEADNFSGFVLYKMGATLEEAETAMNTYASEKGSATHPAKRSRLTAIEAGWTKAKDQDKSNSKNPTVPRTIPDTSSSTGDMVGACGVSIGKVFANKWLQEGGGSGVLGCPASGETNADKSPQGTTGRYVEFKGDSLHGIGSIYWHKTGGYAGQAFIIRGGVLQLYKDKGGSSSWLGFPISDEYDAPNGRRSNFEGGYIFWNQWSGLSQAFKY